MPVTMSGYGQSYMPMGGPDIGAAIYGAQRQQVNFARMVELQRLNLQKRALRQQAAAQAAQLQDRQQARAEEAALQQTKFDLEQRRLDMQDEENQRRRQDILDAFERTERDRRDKEAQAILDEKNRLTEVGATPWDGSGEQPFRYYTTRDGMVWDLSKVDMARLRGGSTQAGAPNMETIRKDLNEISKMGGRLLKEGEQYDSRTHRIHYGADGNAYLVPITDSKGNPVQAPEEQPPMEGFKDKNEYTMVASQFGEEFVTAHPEITEDMKMVIKILDASAKRTGAGERNENDGSMLIKDYRLQTLRDMKNKEQTAYERAKLPKEADHYWEHVFNMAETMVELHDAREATLHQDDSNPDYKKEHRYFKARHTKPYEDAGYRGEELKKKLEEAWKAEGAPQYTKDANERYQRALQSARELGWAIPTDRTAGKFINDWYQLINK